MQSNQIITSKIIIKMPLRWLDMVQLFSVSVSASVFATKANAVLY